MFLLTIQQDGDAASVALPNEVLAKLEVSDGEMIALTETEDGFHIERHDPLFSEAMKAFKETRRNYKNALRELGQ